MLKIFRGIKRVFQFLVGCVLILLIRKEVFNICFTISEDLTNCVADFSNEEKLVYEVERVRITLLPYDKQINVFFKDQLGEVFGHNHSVKLRLVEAMFVAGIVKGVWDTMITQNITTQEV